MPTGVKSNIAKGWPVASWRTREISRLGGVPISVISPPKSEANAIGISTRAGEVPRRRVSCRAAGRNSARAPTLFMKAEAVATSPASTMIWPSARPVQRSNGRSVRSSRPECPSARLITRMAATVTTAGSEKPSKASAAGTTPSSTAASSAISATRS